MLTAVAKYISGAEKDIESEIDKQKKLLKDFDSKCEANKKPFYDALQKIKHDDESPNHVIALVIWVNANNEFLFRLKNTWTGSHISPWFKADFLWKPLSISNVFNEFKVSVVSCSFLFTRGNEIRNEVFKHFNPDSLVPQAFSPTSPIFLCERLYVAAVTGDESLFDYTISGFVGQNSAHKIIKLPMCKQMINGIIRHLVGTASMVMFLKMLETFGKALSYQLYHTGFSYTISIYLLKSEQFAYLWCRVATAYTLFYFLTYGNPHNATLMNPETVTTMKTFAETCINSAIDGEPEIQEKFSTQLWLLMIYLIEYFRPAFNKFGEARIVFPGATHSVAGASSGKLWVIPKRSELFKEIDRDLHTATRHSKAVETIDLLLSGIKSGYTGPDATDQFAELNEMWRKIKVSPRIENGIPVRDFEGTIEILSKIVDDFELWNITFPPSSLGSDASSSGSSQGSIPSPVYGATVKSVYASSDDSDDSDDTVKSVDILAPRTASSGKYASYFSIDAFKSLSPHVKKQTILGIMDMELRGDDAPPFINFSPEDEKKIVSDYVTEFGKKNDPYKEYKKLDQSMEIGGGSRRKVFQKRTKKQKNNNNNNNYKKHKKTKSKSENSRKNKKQTKKPHKKRPPLKTNTNTKRKKC
jgi:hypothetical protein